MKITDKLSRLETWGYSQFFESIRLELGVDIDLIARVTAEHKGAYEIVCLSGESRAVVAGKFMLNALRREDYPAVGDWVVIKDSDTEDEKIIETILPRQTSLSKKYTGKDEAQLIAANVGVAFAVEAMDRDYSMNRFERYIVLALEGGVRPVIVLNKSDLIPEAELLDRINQLSKRFNDIDILCTTTLTDDGLDELSSYIQKGITYSFLGSSGVGKSSIINKLLARNSIQTQSIGTKTGRGKHTTTYREMYFTDDGGIIIDNPGSREVGMVGFGADSKEVFTDIERLAADCRFRDCKHVNESGCAVLIALGSGSIDVEQYENYHKLKKETEHYEMSRYDKRQKNRKFGKFIKNAKQDLKKYKSQ